MLHKEEKSARISDILEQIEDLSVLIDNLKAQGAVASSLHQYGYMKAEFTAELKGLMAEFSFKIEPILIAA